MVLLIGCRSGCPVGIGTARGMRSASLPDDVAAAAVAVAQIRTGLSSWDATESCVTACENAIPSRDDDDDDDGFLGVAVAEVTVVAAVVDAVYVPDVEARVIDCSGV